MAAKHPPAFDCLRCGKQYSSQFALDGHYRGHTDHPNCPICGKGFYDTVSLTTVSRFLRLTHRRNLNSISLKHVREIHNDFWCNTCNIRFETAAAANEHYITSPAHSNCQISGISFRGEDMLHKVS